MCLKAPALYPLDLRRLIAVVKLGLNLNVFSARSHFLIPRHLTEGLRAVMDLKFHLQALILPEIVKSFRVAGDFGVLWMMIIRVFLQISGNLIEHAV